MVVLGNAEEARSLARGIVIKTKLIVDLTYDIKKTGDSIRCFFSR